MTSTAKVTDEEVQAIYATHPRLNECRRTTLESYARTTPSIVPIFTDALNRGELSLIDLIQRKITWGEYVTSTKEHMAELSSRLSAEFQQIGANLLQSHQAELANRQAAANAMMQYYQTQQLINAVNRPVVTNCQGFGSMVNCVSQ